MVRLPAPAGLVLGSVAHLPMVDRGHLDYLRGLAHMDGCSARVLWLCELAVMPALPGVSLGVKFDMEHDAPAVRGSWVTASAKCTIQKGRYWEWDVTVHDAYGKIAKCTLGFIADVDIEDYTARRVTPKIAARNSRASCWLCVLNAFSLIAVLAIPLQVSYLWHGR